MRRVPPFRGGAVAVSAAERHEAPARCRALNRPRTPGAGPPGIVPPAVVVPHSPAGAVGGTEGTCLLVRLRTPRLLEATLSSLCGRTASDSRSLPDLVRTLDALREGPSSRPGAWSEQS